MKPTTLPKLSVASTGLPSGYRRTAYFEVNLPNTLESGGLVRRVDVARFESSTPGQVDAFFALSVSHVIKEITSEEFTALVGLSFGATFVDLESRKILGMAVYRSKQALNDLRMKWVADELNSAEARIITAETRQSSAVAKVLS